jgi:hypothetical protein
MTEWNDGRKAMIMVADKFGKVVIGVQ